MPLRRKTGPDRREARSYEELVVQIAEDKGRPRFRRTLPGTEKPRAVFLESVGKIARPLEEVGFRYSPSGAYATRRTGNAIERVGFRSSPRNVPGELVVLSIVLEIRDQILEAWRKSESLPRSGADPVARRGIGELLDPPRLLEWNLADERRRPATIADAKVIVTQQAIPFLERLGSALDSAEPDPDALRGFVDAPALAEYYIRAGRRQDAGAVVTEIFARFPESVLEGIADQIRRFKYDGLPTDRALEHLFFPYIVVKYDLPVRRP